MSSKVKIVFDVDDTICHNPRKLHYSLCEPDLEVIKKINHLHDDLGFKIVLHTARGMVSCDGDPEKIIAKNKRVLEEWLADNDVHYDEILFCKPIADLYVDDKAIDVEDFKKEDFCELHGGGSNKNLYQLGKVVKKFFGNDQDTEDFKDWVEDNEGSCKFPRVISYLYDAVYMEFIDGENLVDCLTIDDLFKVIGTIFDFSEMKRDSFALEPHLHILDMNMSSDDEMNDMICMCKRFLIGHYGDFERNASYSHGDIILSNVIKSKSGELYFIDPRYFRESSSYLLDFGKLRNSLSGYEYKFGISKNDNSKYLGVFDEIMKFKGIYDIVVGLHLMNVLRLWRYKDQAGKNLVKEIAKGIIKDNEELFELYKKG